MAPEEGLRDHQSQYISSWEVTVIQNDTSVHTLIPLHTHSVNIRMFTGQVRQIDLFTPKKKMQQTTAGFIVWGPWMSVQNFRQCIKYWMKHYSLGQSGVAGNSYSYCLPKCLIKAWAVGKLYLMRGQECYELQPALYLLLWCSIQIWTLCECHNSELLCSFDYSCVTDGTSVINRSYYLWKWLHGQLARCECGLIDIKIILFPDSE